MGQDLWHLARDVAAQSQPLLLAACERALKVLLHEDANKHADVIAQLDRAIKSARIQ